MIIEWLKNERWWQLKWERDVDLWHILFVIWYIENGISYKTSLDIWQIEIIGSREAVLSTDNLSWARKVMKKILVMFTMMMVAMVTFAKDIKFPYFYHL